ncbi:MAG: GNAT family N-acetyltransferase [Alphaproteobacteria bacterium]|nr:GNAT family N-acetyltransferase [Alphaproteobacteria bacterium]
MSIRIRAAVFPADTHIGVAFINALQAFEHALDPDRRIDAGVGDDYFAVLYDRMQKENGCAFIAEDDEGPIGWAVFVPGQAPAYVVTGQRDVGYVAELFVEERARKRGVGPALIKTCEDEARRRGLKVMRIGVLSANANAERVYLAQGFKPYQLELRKFL